MKYCCFYYLSYPNFLQFLPFSPSTWCLCYKVQVSIPSAFAIGGKIVAKLGKMYQFCSYKKSFFHYSTIVLWWKTLIEKLGSAWHIQIYYDHRRIHRQICILFHCMDLLLSKILDFHNLQSKKDGRYENKVQLLTITIKEMKCSKKYNLNWPSQ